MHFMTTPDFDEKSSNFNEPHTHTLTIVQIQCTSDERALRLSVFASLSLSVIVFV